MGATDQEACFSEMLTKKKWSEGSWPAALNSNRPSTHHPQPPNSNPLIPSPTDTQQQQQQSLLPPGACRVDRNNDSAVEWTQIDFCVKSLNELTFFSPFFAGEACFFLSCVCLCVCAQLCFCHWRLLLFCHFCVVFSRLRSM